MEGGKGGGNVRLNKGSGALHMCTWSISGGLTHGIVCSLA